MEIIDNGTENEVKVNNQLSGKININGNIICSDSLKNIDFSIDGNYNNIIIDKNVTIFKKLHLTISGNNGCLKIGKDTTIYSVDMIINEDNNKIEIGSDCMISENVKILASDSHSIILQETYQCICKKQIYNKK